MTLNIFDERNMLVAGTATPATKRKNFAGTVAIKVTQFNSLIDELDNLREEYTRAGYGSGGTNEITQADLTGTEVGYIAPAQIGTVFFNWDTLRPLITEAMRQAFETMKP